MRKIKSVGRVGSDVGRLPGRGFGPDDSVPQNFDTAGAGTLFTQHLGTNDGTNDFHDRLQLRLRRVRLPAVPRRSQTRRRVSRSRRFPVGRRRAGCASA